MAVKVATGRAAERGQGGKTQGPVGHVRLEDTSAVARPGAALTGAKKPREASRQNRDDRRSGVSDPAGVFGAVQVGQGVEGLQRVALGGEVEFGHGAVADAHIELDGGLGRGAQNLPYCG